MAIDHWLGEDGRRAIEVMGWPEWDDDGCETRLRLLSDKLLPKWCCEIRSPVTGDWHLGAEVQEHHALADLRDHARVWLKAHKVHLCVTEILATGEINYYVPGRAGKGGWNEELVPRSDDLRDYDFALIAAILAVEAL